MPESVILPSLINRVLPGKLMFSVPVPRFRRSNADLAFCVA